MNQEVEQLACDYRALDFSAIPFERSNRVLDPVINVSRKGSRFHFQLGANRRKSGESYFVSCPTTKHNWILDGNVVRPLPYDAPDIMAAALGADGSDAGTYANVILLQRDGVEGMKVQCEPDVFQAGKKRCSHMALESPVSGLEAKLYPYQESGVAWMLDALQLAGGVILADEMGLGKTLQIIALLLKLDLKRESPALVVCPATLIANWCREIWKFAPEMTVVVHRGPERTGYYRELLRSQVVITTYDTLANDVSMFRGINWNVLVCDEAQAAKNPDSKRRKALAQVPKKLCIPVTGTPMETSLLDLWSLVDLSVPGLLGDREEFQLRFPDSEESGQELNELVDPVILRRLVRDVADDLPDRIDVDLPVEMSDGERANYEQVRNDVIEKYDAAGRLVAVGQLALFCAHPWLVADSLDADAWEDSVLVAEAPTTPMVTPKMEVCLNLLREAFLSKKKVLLFSIFNRCGDIIRRAAADAFLPPAYWNAINGETPQEERQPIVDEFSAFDGPGVLLLNPKAAGAGLNITAATVVIHYTQNWNPAVEMQASARAHRRGQEEPVNVYRLYYQGTVEESMVERSQWRRELGDLTVPISAREDGDLDSALTKSPVGG